MKFTDAALLMIMFTVFVIISLSSALMPKLSFMRSPWMGTILERANFSNLYFPPNYLFKTVKHYEESTSSLNLSVRLVFLFALIITKILPMSGHVLSSFSSTTLPRKPVQPVMKRFLPL